MTIPPLYSYMDLLQLVYDKLDTHHKATGNLSTPHPQLVKMTGKKVMFVNFPKTCESIHRPPEHVQSFIVSELSTDFSVDSFGRLILRDKFNSKQMESIISSYIHQYVQCGACKKFNTELQKDPITRLTNMICKNCKASRTVAPIKDGFHATTKADRKKK
jgi:translation initiation factor 2 subunit 2